MRPRQRPQARRDRRSEFFGAIYILRAERDDAARDRKQVLHPVRHLSDEQVLLLLTLLRSLMSRAIFEPPITTPSS